MKLTEPPSLKLCSKPSYFQIGRNSRGHWVVQDEQGTRGGLFIDRTQALRFAMFENGNRPQAVVMVAGVFELDMSRKATAANHQPPNTEVPRERRVA